MSAHHDALFRSAFSQAEHAAGVLKFALPANVLTRVDWSTLRLAPSELVERKTELLFATKLDGASTYLYLMFEDESSVEVLIAARIFSSISRILERWYARNPGAEHLPIVLPIVLYHGRQPWDAPTSLEEVLAVGNADPEFVRRYLPGLQFSLVDLPSQDEVVLRERVSTALARLVLLVFRSSAQGAEIAEDLGRWADLMREVYRAPHGAQALVMVLRYVLEQTGAPERIESLVVEALGDEAREVYATAADGIRR